MSHWANSEIYPANVAIESVRLVHGEGDGWQAMAFTRPEILTVRVRAEERADLAS